MAYIKGHDMLFSVNSEALGSCESHEISYDTDTKEVAVKPESTKGEDDGLFKEQIVTGLGISVSFSGLMTKGKTVAEKQSSYDKLLAAWKAGQPVDGAAFYRSGDATPYLQGKFIIKSLKESHKSGDFSTYSGNVVLSGAPTVMDDSKFQPGLGA